MTPKTQEIKDKRKLDFVNIKNFYISKDMIKKIKNQARNWEKILVNHISALKNCVQNI